MEVLLSAVASDLVGRLVSFLVSKFHHEPDSGTDDDDVVRLRLQRALLRASVVVEEAEEREVTSRAMLLQLAQLREAMCRAAYVLDASISVRRAVDRSRRSHAAAPAAAGPSRSPPGFDALPVAVSTLEAALSGVQELVILLGACPRLGRQPYSAYLFAERCMFGRQMEKEHIVGFLLLRPAAPDQLDVLPVIGPHDVGKRTLVEHACLDERVRRRFSKVVHLSSYDLDGLQGCLVDAAAAARSLFVIDLAAAGDEELEEQWRRFRLAVRRRAHRESKIIVISRTEKHSSLGGTVPPLRLRAPRREELWYLFKALAFGGTDPGERPELVRVAMALFKIIPDHLAAFAVANKMAAPLRADQSAASWRRVLKVTAGVTELQLGAGAGAAPATGGPHRPEWETGYYYPLVPVKDAAAPSAPCLFYNRRKSTGAVARSELPEVTMLDIVRGVVPGGEKRFDVLLWQSRIPPYGSYVATCHMDSAAQVVVEKKRLQNKRRRGQLVHGSGEDKVGR